MNSVVDSTKQKLMALHDSLSSFIDDPSQLDANSIENGPDWPNTLAHFNALISKWESMTDTVQSAAMLKQLIVVPQALPLADPDSVPRELLKTRLIQDVVDADEAVKERLYESVADGVIPPPASNPLDQTAVRGELRAWVSLVDQHDTIAEFAATYVDEFDEYNLKDRLPDDAAVGSKLTTAQLQSKLEETVRWMANGK
ncbi:hypothetical protein HDU81_001434 [Chytriomyces hyalinus]|nr:hypothetical protein HDU81_001434 [Chytriomyces hyalinus]